MSQYRDSDKNFPVLGGVGPRNSRSVTEWNSIIVTGISVQSQTFTICDHNGHKTHYQTCDLSWVKGAKSANEIRACARVTIGVMAFSHKPQIIVTAIPALRMRRALTAVISGCTGRGAA